MEAGKARTSLGATVKISHQHWLRGLEQGMVIGYRPRAQKNWLVKFDERYPGGGIDGDKLYFNESEFIEIRDPDASLETPTLASNEFLISAPGLGEKPAVASNEFVISAANGHDIRQ
ncbi:MAG TPA: hypothetical protein VGL11_02865 [Candidatus Binatia bacterium]|jgi:hypothetical protein